MTTASDRIRLVGIEVRGHHGVFEHERRDGQRFLADVTVHLDTRAAAAGDDLAATLDYGLLAERVAAVLAGEPAALVETVAERIAATVLDFPVAHAVDVAVHKPEAPVAVGLSDVVVEVHRSRTSPPVVAGWAPAVSEQQADLVVDGAPEPVPPEPVLPEPVEPEPVLPGPAPALPGPADRLDEAPEAPVRVVLALGANLGDPRATLRRAVADLDEVPGLVITDVSPLARTAAVGGPEQPDYLNAVLLARTTLSPRTLLHAVRAIEATHGRVRTEPWGPRTLDIDIVDYDGMVAVSDDLELPHPRAHARAFVLGPWSHVDPDAVLHGLGGGPVTALAETAPDRDGIRWLALDWLVPGETGPVRTEGTW